jgi:hypothetical protein
LNVALQSVQDITTEKDALSEEKAETERLLQEKHLSLQTLTQQNANLIQRQQELNQNAQAMTLERDAAVNHHVDTTRNLNETRALLHIQTLESTSYYTSAAAFATVGSSIDKAPDDTSYLVNFQ